MMPTSPEVARKAIRFSFSRRNRIGGQSGDGSSSGMRAGIQYSRRNLPIGVSVPTRHINSLSVALSMWLPPLLVSRLSLAEGSLGRVEPLAYEPQLVHIHTLIL